MTNYEKIKSMSVDELATAIYNGISSDPCDYCEYNNLHCTGIPCNQKANTDIIAEWLESETEPTLCEDKKNNLRHCEDCHENCREV